MPTKRSLKFVSNGMQSSLVAVSVRANKKRRPYRVQPAKSQQPATKNLASLKRIAQIVNTRHPIRRILQQRNRTFADMEYVRPDVWHRFATLDFARTSVERNPFNFQHDTVTEQSPLVVPAKQQPWLKERYKMST